MRRLLFKSRINGSFLGWSGETIYQLDNGSIWKQSKYHYHYHYAYRPEVSLIEESGVIKMYVSGDEPDGQEVKRIG